MLDVKVADIVLLLDIAKGSKKMFVILLIVKEIILLSIENF